MSKPQIKGIIWDFGNVLARFDHSKACKKLAKYSTVSPEDIFEVFFGKNNSLVKLHESGRLSSQEFFLAGQKAAHLAENLSFREFCIIWKDIFQENNGVESIIDKIRPDLKRCILSNTDPIHWSAIEQLPVMKKYFSNSALLVRSYISGARKPDIKIYRDALKCLGFAETGAKHVLYIEDTAEYRDAFERMGGNVLSYNCSKDTLAQLEAGLIKFDVLRA